MAKNGFLASTILFTLKKKLKICVKIAEIRKFNISAAQNYGD